jgi:hypothetical protein
MEMKNTKLLKLSIVLILLATMVAINVETVFASSTKGMTLDDFIFRFAQYKSNGNATEANRIINEMTASEQIKQDKIAATNGAILQPADSSSQVSSGPDSITSTTGWMSYVINHSPPTYDSQTGYMVGCIQNWNNLAGQNPDSNYALLWTNGWNENYNNPEGGEAFAFGAVWNGQSGWMNGNIYIYAYNGVPSWQNYVIVSYYDGSTWHYLTPNYQVPNTSPAWVYMGYTSTQFTQIAVECWTPPPYPIYYSPLIMNYVFIDSVRIVS